MKTLSVIISVLLCMGMACNTRSGKDQTTGPASDKFTFSLEERWRTDTVLQVPECVLYDADDEVLYVSNIANRDQPEGSGFITKLGLDGTVLDLKWVEGITFPKGMVKYEGTLYVTELSSVAVIDMEKAQLMDRIHIDSALFLNDLSVDAEGNLFVSDSRGHCVYRISDGEVSKILSEGIPRPNGVLYEDGRLLLTSVNNQEFLSMSCEDHSLTVLADSIGHGDGIADAGIPGHYLVSSWRGKVFMVYPDGSTSLLLDTEDAEIQSADITYVIDRKLLLVPTFYGNTVVGYELISD